MGRGGAGACGCAGDGATLLSGGLPDSSCMASPRADSTTRRARPHMIAPMLHRARVFSLVVVALALLASVTARAEPPAAAPPAPPAKPDDKQQQPPQSGVDRLSVTEHEIKT